MAEKRNVATKANEVGGKLPTQDELLKKAEKAGITKDAKEANLQEVVNVIAGVLDTTVRRVEDLEKTLEHLKTGGKNMFMDDADAQDIQEAKESRQNVHATIVQIVDETLGQDFKIEVTPEKDTPGFLFSILVPARLSDRPLETRPVMGEDGKQEKDELGNPVFAEYKPEDRRSRRIAAADNFEAIKAHCEKVRANLVGYYQKTNKPLPEFQTK